MQLYIGFTIYVPAINVLIQGGVDTKVLPSDISPSAEHVIQKEQAEQDLETHNMVINSSQIYGDNYEPKRRRRRRRHTSEQS